MLMPKVRFPEFRGEEGWEKTILGDLSEVVRGGSPRPIDGFLTTDADGLNWLKIGDVDKEAKYVTHTAEKVRPEALSKTRVVNAGDLILSNSMSFGRPYILEIKTCIHDGWIAITKIAKKADRDFLYYLISAPTSQSYFEDNAAGSGVQNLNADIIKALPVCFPSPAEQQKIAECLSSVDELMAAQARKVDALKTHKKGLMQQLFPREGETQPRLRFPEFENAGEWQTLPLVALADKIMVGIASAATHAYRETGVPMLRNQNIKEGKIDDSSLLFIDPAYEAAHKNKRLRAGDVITVRTGYPGVSAVVPERYNNAQCFTSLITRPNKAVLDANYLCAFVNSEIGKRFILGAEAGGAQKNVNAGSLEALPVYLPETPEQQRIAECLSSLDARITAETQKLETLKTHKRGLMQQLFPSPE